MIEWTIIGLAVGIVMAFAGAGGGLVSIPLFVHWIGLPIKEATYFSLFAVMTGALLNGIAQRSYARISMALVVSLASFPASFVASSWKQSLSDRWIIGLYFGLVGSSLVAFWLKRPGQAAAQSQRREDLSFSDWIKLVLMGTGLGALTTLTGLGGGVLLVPAFGTIFRMRMVSAVATSLWAIFFAALGSAAMQGLDRGGALPPKELIGLACGCIASALLVGRLLKKWEGQFWFDDAQRYLYTLVLLSSILGLLKAV